jgi:hypothetical protein
VSTEPQHRPATSATAWIAGALSLPMVVTGAALFGARALGVAPPVPCPLTELTGVPCPACGVSRATEALLTLDPAGVASQLPAALLVVAMAVMSLAVVVAGLPGRSLGRRTPVAYLSIVGVLFVTNGIWQLVTSS